MPILASLNPNCERFSFRVFWIRYAVTVNFTFFVLILRWVAWVILLHLRFLFIRLPSSRRCGLAETVGLCFRVDSDRATLVFVLGLVCVCVSVGLFCSVVVLFVVGWQQHCRYIVIDAMVYRRAGSRTTNLVLERLWGLWTEFGIPTSGFEEWKKILNLEVTTLCMNRRRWVLDDASSSILHFGRRVRLWLSFDHECDLEPWTFFFRVEHLSVQGSDVMGWNAMSKGGMEIWHPVGAPFG